MEKTYNPHEIEQRWYQTWEERGYFAPSGESTADAQGSASAAGGRMPGAADAQGGASAAGGGKPKAAYCIMIPPPNVTGSLHMGHAFQDTIMDALIRYHRMQGDNTLWQAGTDHAGIATQMVVERQLAVQGLSRHDLGREAFIDKVWEWKAESGGTITRQLRRLGASLDWSRERFTMDEGLSEAVKEVFVRLYEEGLIYRGKRLVNWDPVLRTAVSDLEVINEEDQGYLWHIRYPLADGSGHLVVATTRPETMLGDTAVAVHPGDERYKHLIGRMIALPLTGREIPIIADEYVDPAFGTGCVKITPAHDFNDYKVGQRHDLPMINVFTPDAKINENGPEQYRGLDRYEARDEIVRDLKELELLEKIDDHKLMVPRGDRSHSVIEPFLTDQWYVKVGPLAEEAIKVVEDGRIRFVPDNWKNTYFDWMRRIEDWCISRQIWWGHRVPAWYDPQGNVYVGRSEAEVREKHKLGFEIVLEQDQDVLDTWFSSALWPFSTLGWPENTKELQTFYPTSVLVTAFDIIFFWVARMIMMGLKFMGDVPFREVYIHGLVRDAHGQKMSKSKGNVLDPIDLIDGIDLESLVQKRTSGLMQPEMAKKIEKATRKEFPEGIPAFGTDALRFTLAALASTGRDINFDLGRIEGYRNFCNKLWNAARYVLTNTEGQDTGKGDAQGSASVAGGTTAGMQKVEQRRKQLPRMPGATGAMEFSAADRWILSRLEQAKKEVIEAIEGYRFDLAAQAIYEFTWNEYCDWYLELSKPVLTSAESTEAQRRGARHTLAQVLEELLRLMHPIMPFITEEIWQRAAPLAGKTGTTIMLQPYPLPDPSKFDAEAVRETEWIKNFVLGIRRIRGEMNIAPGKPLPVLLQGGDETDRQRVEKNRLFLATLARLGSCAWLPTDARAPAAATALVGELKIFIPMAGLIDVQAELARLGKERDKLLQELTRSENKLGNPDFTNRAPADVVKKEQQRVAEMRSALAKIEAQVERIGGLP